ncbi:hypothetical protein J4479_00995 [Candidatus Woesearchaeota archaeon]|nr:hypothetical protein [Candidatus Woesearchaeota archaeon]
MTRNLCDKCGGVCALITGALILVNAFWWPRWLGVDGWVTFLAVLLVLSGFIKLVLPNKCSSCNALACETKPAKAKK